MLEVIILNKVMLVADLSIAFAFKRSIWRHNDRLANSFVSPIHGLLGAIKNLVYVQRRHHEILTFDYLNGARKAA